jgi:hypothetical protein
MPSTDGPAKGFRNKVCMRRPLAANPAPASAAVIALGSRNNHRMFAHEARSGCPPVRIVNTLLTGMLTDPSDKSKKNALIRNNPKRAYVAKLRPNRGCIVF